MKKVSDQPTTTRQAIDLVRQAEFILNLRIRQLAVIDTKLRLEVNVGEHWTTAEGHIQRVSPTPQVKIGVARVLE